VIAGGFVGGIVGTYTVQCIGLGEPCCLVPPPAGPPNDAPQPLRQEHGL
jgi:hypothetical protein